MYLRFCKTYDAFADCPYFRLSSKLRKGTDVPIPANNADFEQCKIEARACKAAADILCPIEMSKLPGGLTPTLAEIHKRPDRAIFYAAMQAQWRDLMDPRRPCFEIIDRSELPPGRKVISFDTEYLLRRLLALRLDELPRLVRHRRSHTCK